MTKPDVDRTPAGRPFTRPVVQPTRPTVPTDRGGRGSNGGNGTKGDGGNSGTVDPIRDNFGERPNNRPDRPSLGDAGRPRTERPSLVGDRTGRPDTRDRIVGSRLSGVDLHPSKASSASGAVASNGGSVNYITNITYANNSWGHHGDHHGYDDHHWGHRWHAPLYGSYSCWNGWDHDGFSFGVGFGHGGFSFGLFYSSWGSPLCSSWNDPWWDGYCGSVVVNCPPRYRWCRPCWSPCGTWYSNYIVYREVPASWCTPVYAWTPTYAVPSVTTINNYYGSTPAVTSAVYTQPATSVPTALPASSPAEAEAWDLLSNGFPRSSADTFARLHDADPGNTRSLMGYALSLAMLEDISGSASVMRQALSTDPSLVATVPLSEQLVDRVRLLEQTAEVASRQTATSRDALFLLGSWRAMQGRFTEAHLAILNAQQAGEQSLAAARLRSWLEGRLTPPL